MTDMTLLPYAFETIWRYVAHLFKRTTTHSVQKNTMTTRSRQAGLVRFTGTEQPVLLSEKLKRRYQPSRSIRLGPPLIVPKREPPIWQQKGWTCKGNEYRGSFHACGRSWQGIINIPYTGCYEVYIKSPPMNQIRTTAYSPCFSEDSRYWRYWSVHFHSTPRNLVHAIGTVEDVLSGAMTGVYV